jgi:hypothetical protein
LSYYVIPYVIPHPLLLIRNFGAFLTLSPEFCFVVEDDHSVVGFVAAAANAKELQRQVRVAWIPEMQTKYRELFQSNSTGEDNIPSPLKVNKTISIDFYFSFLVVRAKSSFQFRIWLPSCRNCTRKICQMLYSLTIHRN